MTTTMKQELEDHMYAMVEIWQVPATIRNLLAALTELWKKYDENEEDSPEKTEYMTCISEMRHQLKLEYAFEQRDR